MKTISWYFHALLRSSLLSQYLKSAAPNIWLTSVSRIQRLSAFLSRILLTIGTCWRHFSSYLTRKAADFRIIQKFEHEFCTLGHLYLISEKSSSINWIFSLQKSISKLIFVGYTGSKNPLWNRLKIQFIKLDFSNLIFQKSSTDWS